MELAQLAQIGEFLGGLSVLLTMMYLAIQVRSNTKAVRAAAAQETHDALSQGYLQLAQARELNRLFRVGTAQGIEALEPNEVGHFIAMWSYTLYVTQKLALSKEPRCS